MLFKKVYVILAISLIMLLSACSGSSTQEEIYDHLEKAVVLEDAFEELQDPIIKLEKQEQEIYAQIIDLGMGDFDEIKELSQKAIGIIDDRFNKIKLEKESIDSSKEEFLKIQDSIEELDDQKAIEKANKLYEVMMKRYEAYDNLYGAYNESLSLEKELYTLLQKEDIKEEALTEHITKINESYEKVIKVNAEFNEYTMQYNELKKEFYDVVGIEVTYEEEESPTKDLDVEEDADTPDKK